ncbi:MAG TPA: hypothetical protein VGD88_15405 [Opitutaceae bacterium]
MKNRSTTAESSEQLAENLRTLIAEAEKALTTSVGEQAEGHLADLHDRLESARERVAALCAEAKVKVAAGAKQADATIRSHPYESLAIALGVGVLLGAVLRRNA